METKIDVDYIMRVKNIVRYAIKELSDGKTFYNGYFKGNEYSILSRADRALFILSQIDGNSELGQPENIPARLKHLIKGLNNE